MIVITGASLVLPDRVLPHASLLIDGELIAGIEPRVVDSPARAQRIDARGCFVVPGFIDVHVHGVEGHDVLDDDGAIIAVAARLPKYGVTAFCPTSVACDPGTLDVMLDAVGRAQLLHDHSVARVLPAHLESNFINPDYRGAQPAQCLRTPGVDHTEGAFTGRDILNRIAAKRRQVGIVTLAPELAGGVDLTRELVDAGHLVSIGHTGATYEEACAAIDAGVSHATHLFNRMTPMTHRAPGTPGAVLVSERVTAELICDGFHVHPALMRVVIRAKGPDGIMAITDGTAGSGLTVGSVTRLGGRPITVTERTAVLDDGTLAGSVLTMDRAFRRLVSLGVSLVEAARMCATTPARQLRLSDTGRLAVGSVADLVVLDSELLVRDTFLRGVRWRNPSSGALV